MNKVIVVAFLVLFSVSSVSAEDPSGFVLKWGEMGSRIGQYGNVYVADTFNDRVQKFTSSGSFLSTWGELGADEGDFDSPEDIAIGADIFNYDLNDLVVPISSQLGGCAQSTTVANQDHASMENAAMAAGSVVITGPSTGTTVIAGNVVPIMVEGMGDVARLQLTAGNRGLDVYSEVLDTPSTTFNYQIPINAAGTIIVVVSGYGDAGFVDMDSIAINVLIEANLDRITLFPDELYVMETEMATFSVTGHFDDGIDRELSFHPDITYEIADTLIAKFIEPGIVQGVSEGTTSAIATFQGDTASALIVVLPDYSQTGIDDGGR